MKKIKMLFNFRVIYVVSLIYFFLGYFEPNFLQINNVYLYIYEYLGEYEKILWIFLIGYGFSLFMKNPNKRAVFKTRLSFMVILGIATGYLYLVSKLKGLGEVPIEEIQQLTIQFGLLNINLGYIELYTFLKIFSYLRVDIFIGYLIFIIFISLIIICGKMIRKSILFVVDIFRRYIAYRKEVKELEEKRVRLEKQAELEREIYDEICSIQKIYQEKDMLNNSEEDLENAGFEEIGRKENDDISIQLSETERDIGTTGI